MPQTASQSIPTSADIVVAGGGPAGATIARLLAGYGFHVVLIEKRRFPRYQIGESLTPRILPLFDFLGIRSRIEAASFLPITGHTVCWGSPQPRTAYYSPDRMRHGFQVWRPDFDSLLLEHARQSDVQIVEGQAVTGMRFHAGDRVTLQTASQQRITASFFIDATGHSGLLAGQGWRQRDPIFQTLAITAYWHGVQEEDGFNRGNTLIEAYPNGMLWSLPLHTGLRNVTVLLDWSAGQQIRETSLAEFYTSELGQAAYTSSLLHGAQIRISPRACDASLYTATTFATERALLVGDAGLFIDPLSSEGVHKAMASAITGAVVVNTILRRPWMRSQAIAFYHERQQQTYNSHYQQSVTYYREERRWSEQVFWQRRAGAMLQAQPQAPPILSQPQTLSHLQWSSTVSIEQRPTIEGVYIELREAAITPRYPNGVRYLDRVCVPTLLRVVKRNPAIGAIIPAYLGHPDGKDCPPEAVRQALARCYQEGLLVKVPPYA